MIILFGFWIGLLTGFAEVIVQELTLHVFGRFLVLGRHFVWMVPLVDAVLFLLIGLVLALAHRLRPRWITASRAVGVLAFVGMGAVLLLLPQLHPVTMVLLAAGVGVQVARVIGPRLASLAAFARKSATGLACIVVILALGFIIQERLGERRALARLPPAPVGAPNVLLIILDTVRGLNLSLYGYPRPTTPVIDRWAQGGVVFDRAFAEAPWTLPSHASMFTGRHAYELEASWETPLEAGPLTLAEALGRRGYATAGFVANVRYTATETGLARGFAHYEDYRVDVGEAIKSATLTAAFHASFNRKLHLPPIRPRTWAREINGRFTRWLDQRDTTHPFFVFLNYMDAHAPYTPPPAFRARFETHPGASIPNIDDSRPNNVKHPSVRFTLEEAAPSMDLYDGAIAGLDAEIGRLLAELERRGLLENTLVVLASDHGEAFAEHGLLGHANSLYRPLLQVPLVIWFPHHVPAGLRVPDPVTLRDLAATITEIAGDGKPEFPGASLARYWNGGASEPAAGPLVSHIRKLINQPAWWPASHGDMFAIVTGRFHYIQNQGDEREELFDLETDLTEQHDLAQTAAGQRELPSLRQALQQLHNATPPPVH